MNDKLKPCPFCGGEVEMKSLGGNAFCGLFYTIECKQCHISRANLDKNAAITSWNRHAEAITQIKGVKSDG